MNRDNDIRIVPGFCAKNRRNAQQLLFYVGADLDITTSWYVLVLDDYHGLRLKTIIHEHNTWSSFMHSEFEIVS